MRLTIVLSTVGPIHTARNLPTDGNQGDQPASWNTLFLEKQFRVTRGKQERLSFADFMATKPFKHFLLPNTLIIRQNRFGTVGNPDFNESNL